MRNVALLAFPLAAGVVLLVCCGGDEAALPAPEIDGGVEAAAPPPPGEDDGGPLPAGAVLTLAKKSRWVIAGGQSRVDFAIARKGVAGALRVHVDGLPAGVSAADVDVGDGVSAGTLTLVASTSAVLGAVANASVRLSLASQQEDAEPLTVRVSGKPGAPDVTFGDGGKGTLSVPSSLGIAVAVLPPSAGADAGKIVIAGNATFSSTDVRVFVARFRTDGTLDPTFGDLVDDAGPMRMGVTLFDPGPSAPSFPTYVAAMKIDSKGRIAVTNGRKLSDGECGVELSRFDANGVVDPSFARYSDHLEATNCGEVLDLAFTSTDDVALLARWNEDQTSTPPQVAGTTATLVQLFSEADGSAKGASHRVFLDTTGGEKSTLGYGITIDASGRFVIAGAQCDGGWVSKSYACTSILTRLGADGQPDTTFGSQPSYTSFQLGSGAPSLPQSLRHVTVDPKGGDLVAAGHSDGEKLGTLARVNGTTGAPAAFGTFGAVTPDLVTGATVEVITRAMIDSEDRIVFAGEAVTTGGFIVSGRAGVDGTLDATYGEAGLSSPLSGGGIDAALDADDRLYVVGYSGSSAALYRFWP